MQNNIEELVKQKAKDREDTFFRVLERLRQNGVSADCAAKTAAEFICLRVYEVTSGGLWYDKPFIPYVLRDS